MPVSALILRQDFETAIDSARSLGPEHAVPGLASPLDVDWAGRIGRVWDRIEQALREAFQYGRERAEELARTAAGEAEELLTAAGHKAYDVHQALLAKLQAYVSTLVDAALAHVRSQLILGGTTFVLADVELAQMISMTGSLKASITELVSLTSSGEISVTARYSAASNT
ncbi:hypothetical protein [Streptomyces afghaniensis]|uniref:hypothetical protein n=1 Tax=Streptomyces afghaniensis TaxID=66865 RepID=UPI00277F61C3|nr:hypothetical protein [Streptomyces afghaniensis]MDQ1013543.1 hypothetical protein [Streptomyces afghaniensis]